MTSGRKWGREDFLVQNELLISYHFSFFAFVVWQQFPDEMPSSAQVCCQFSSEAAAVILQTVMALTCEAFLRLTGSKAARTPPQLPSDSAGV